jgi:hypothetical protein
MAFDSFSGSPPDPFKDDDNDGYITITGPEDDPPKINPQMKNFGNTEMASFKKDTSAINIVNSTPTKAAFNLGNPPPTPIGQTQPQRKKILGDIQWRSNETLMVGGSFFIAGVMAVVLFNRYYKG